jgi:hypothetical protein
MLGGIFGLLAFRVAYETSQRIREDVSMMQFSATTTLDLEQEAVSDEAKGVPLLTVPATLLFLTWLRFSDNSLIQC